MYPRKVPADFLDGGVGLINDGTKITLANFLRALTESSDVALADVQAAKAVNGEQGGHVSVAGLSYRWDAESEVNDSTNLVSIRPTEIASSDPGRYVLAQQIADLKFPITFATANNAVLFTVPTGVVIQPLEFWWEVTTNFTGGSSSAIGVSSNKSSYNTAGDLLGGASGNVAAALTMALSPNLGTIGAEFDTLAKRRVFLKATETIVFNRITSAFTAGVGSVVMRCAVLYT